MGWTYTDRLSGESILDFFKREFPSLEILDSAVVRLHTFYAAARIPQAPTPDKVFAFICRIDPKGDRAYNFGYRDMDESEDPVDAECPERILNLLSDPPINDSAARWRERCRAHIASQKAHTEAHRALPKLAVGMLVCSEKPLVLRGDPIHHLRIDSISRTQVRGVAYLKPDAKYGYPVRVSRRQLGNYTVLKTGEEVER